MLELPLWGHILLKFKIIIIIKPAPTHCLCCKLGCFFLWRWTNWIAFFSACCLFVVFSFQQKSLLSESLTKLCVRGSTEARCTGYSFTNELHLPVVDAPVETEVEGAEFPAFSHHLHHSLVVQLRNVPQIKDSQVLQLKEQIHTNIYKKKTQPERHTNVK